MNAVTMHGASPIMRAIESSRADVVEYLLEKGASRIADYNTGFIAILKDDIVDNHNSTAGRGVIR